MIFFFMTPMYFLADSVSGMLGNVIWLNPFTYYIEAFHSMVYFGEIPEMKVLLMCIILPLVSMMLGLAVFRGLKRGFAERL
jgi:lipopolysaccharide transport system permease protein